MKLFDKSYLEDSSILGINLVDTHSDHEAFVCNSNLKNTFNDNWKYKLLTHLTEVNETLENVEIDCKTFNDYQFPNYIRLDNLNSNKLITPILEGPAIVYYKNFNYKIEKGLERTFISFDSVQSALYLYVNDTFVGYGEYSGSPLEFELTNYLNKGDNSIIIVVCKYCSSSISLNCENDFIGLTGNVWIYKRPKNYIFDIDAKTHFINGIGILDLYFIFNNQIYERDIKIELFNKEKTCIKLVDKSMSVLKIFRDNQLHFEFDDIKEWNELNPNLYTLKITMLENKTYYLLNVSFKQLEIVNNLPYINKKPLKIDYFNDYLTIFKDNSLLNIPPFIKILSSAIDDNKIFISSSHELFESLDAIGVFFIIDIENKKDKNLNLNLIKRFYKTFKNHPSFLGFRCDKNDEEIFNIFSYLRLKKDNILVQTADKFFDLSDIERLKNNKKRNNLESTKEYSLFVHYGE